MRRHAAVALLAAAVSAAATASAGAAPAPDPTATALRVASGVTRLKIRKQVEVARLPASAARAREGRLGELLYPPRLRAHDAVVYHALGLSPSVAAARSALDRSVRRGAFYDVQRRRLVLPRGAAPGRHALVREVTIALLDEHFVLGRVLRRGRDRDALVAARAAWEGYARLVAQLVAPVPAPAAARGDRLARFLALEEGFHGSAAVRFAARLRNLGSNRAVYTALKAFPTSTEQVLHLERFLQRERPAVVALPAEAAGFRLAGSSTFGELGVRALLAVAGVPGLDRAATGWGGGRTAVYRDEERREAVALVLEWDTAADADQWATAVGGLDTLLRDRAHAFARNGRRTVLAVATDPATATSVASTLAVTST